jgi:MFS family permease
VTAKTIGFFYMYIGTISVFTRALVLGPAVDRFGEARLSRLGATMLALGIAALPFVPRIDSGIFLIAYLPVAAAIAFIPLGTAFTFPCVTALLSKVVPSHERGLYMGVQQTFGGLSRVLFPVLAGWAFDWHMTFPFIVSAALVALTIFLGIDIEGRMKPAAPTDTATARSAEVA